MDDDCCSPMFGHNRNSTTSTESSSHHIASVVRRHHHHHHHHRHHHITTTCYPATLTSTNTMRSWRQSQWLLLLLVACQILANAGEYKIQLIIPANTIDRLDASGCLPVAGHQFANAAVHKSRYSHPLTLFAVMQHYAHAAEGPTRSRRFYVMHSERVVAKSRVDALLPAHTQLSHMQTYWGWRRSCVQVCLLNLRACPRISIISSMLLLCSLLLRARMHHLRLKHVNYVDACNETELLSYINLSISKFHLRRVAT